MIYEYVIESLTSDCNNQVYILCSSFEDQKG